VQVLRRAAAPHATAMPQWFFKNLFHPEPSASTHSSAMSFHTPFIAGIRCLFQPGGGPADIRPTPVPLGLSIPLHVFKTDRENVSTACQQNDKGKLTDEQAEQLMAAAEATIEGLP